MTPIRWTLLAVVAAALLQLGACAGQSSVGPSAPATPAAAFPASAPLVCLREGETCGPKGKCCDGLVCIGSRASFCASGA